MCLMCSMEKMVGIIGHVLDEIVTGLFSLKDYLYQILFTSKCQNKSSGNNMFIAYKYDSVMTKVWTQINSGEGYPLNSKYIMKRSGSQWL